MNTQSLERLWPELDEIFQQKPPEDWFDLVQVKLLKRQDLSKVYLSSKTMAHAYTGKNMKLTCGFALVAGLSSLFNGRLHPAVEIYTWLKRLHSNHFVTSKLHSLLASHLGEANSPNSKQEIENLPFFAGLSKEELEGVLRIPEYRAFKAGDVFFKIGDQPQKMFLITSGIVQMIDAEGTSIDIREGEHFGEISLLLSKSRHSKAACAKTDGEILEFNQTQLSDWFKICPEAQDKIIHSTFFRSFINYTHRIAGLKTYRQSDLLQIFSAFKPKAFKQGMEVFTPGEDAQDFYFILEGHIEIFDEEERVTQLGPGQFLGEMALLEERPRHHRAIAKDRCFALHCTKESFQQLCHNFPRFAESIELISKNRINSRRSRP